MDSTQLIVGGSHTDARGTISFVNDFDMKPVRRCYLISHPDTSIVRAWQGHRKEAKFFRVLDGSFKVAVVKLDNVDSPSNGLEPEVYILKADDNTVLCVPCGYANGMLALEPGSRIMVMSDKTLEECQDDQVRYDSKMWGVF